MDYLWFILKSAFVDWWRYGVMEFLRFIFSSFWVWLGFIILLSMVGGGVIELVKACKRGRKVTGCRVGQRWHVEIENATAEDARSITIAAAYAPEEGCESENEQEQPGDNAARIGGQIRDQKPGDRAGNT